MELIEKKCPQCRRILPINNFSKDKHKASGYVSWCKECIKKKKQQITEANQSIDVYKKSEDQGIFTKKCKKCGEEKPIREFQKLSSNKDGIDTICKDCRLLKGEEREKRLKQKREAAKIRYTKKKDTIHEYNQKYYYENREKLLKQKKEYLENNHEAIVQRRKDYWNTKAKQRLKEDDLFAFKTKIRGFMYDSLVRRKGYSKKCHSYEILGCSYEEAWNHLKQTWLKNYGKEWNGEPYHIDHIVPLSTATTKEEVENLCNIENLQMLTPEDNMSKGDKLDWEVSNFKEEDC